MPPAGVALTWLSIRQNLRVRSGREWRVKKIHARQWKEVKGKKVLFYKIEWDGARKDTWQPAADVERTAEEAVQDFIDRADRASSGQHRRKRSAAASDED